MREAFLREALVARLQGFEELLCLVAGAWGDGFKSLASRASLTEVRNRKGAESDLVIGCTCHSLPNSVPFRLDDCE